MKSTNILGVLVLAACVTSCMNTGDATPGCAIDPATGRCLITPGPAPTSTTTNACANAGDAEKLDSDSDKPATYTPAGGTEVKGLGAYLTVGSACIQGASASLPAVAGCAQELTNYLLCIDTGCVNAVAALSGCLSSCVKTTTEVSSGCASCAGELYTCFVRYCRQACAQPASLACGLCLCQNYCVPNYNTCAGALFHFRAPDGSLLQCPTGSP